MTSLLIVSVGPVQDFIAASRRCHDHWFGSWLLGQVTSAAVEAIRCACGADCIVFPKATGNDACGANKIVAVVEDPEAAARAARAAVRDRACELLCDAMVGCPQLARSGVDFDRAQAQVRELNEVIWVAVPLSSDSGYGSARDRAESLLAARKNSRSWSPPSWDQGSGLPKSSLDGMRETVLMAPARPRDDPDRIQAWRSLAGWLRLRPGETLCGVGVLKRRGAMSTWDQLQRPPVHSTSHVAAAPLLARLARGRVGADRAQAALDAYVAELAAHRIRGDLIEIRDGWVRTRAEYDARLPGQVRVDAPRTFPVTGARGVDGAIFFEGRVKEMLDEISTEILEPPPQFPDRLRQALRRCLTAFGVTGDQPNPYYAVLLADGDHMGESIDRRETREDHVRISAKLTDFANGVRAQVECFGGSLIYAGGDDVLALLPLHTVLDCARKLHDEFEKVVGRMTVRDDSLEEMFPATSDWKRPSLSVGIAIVHHIEDLGVAHGLAREAERLAKDGPAGSGGRDALGIVLSKRGGADLRYFARWSENPDQHIYRWCELLYQEAVPDKLPFEIEAAIEPFEVRGPDFGAAEGVAPGESQVPELVASLIGRVVDRRRAERGDAKLHEQARSEVTSRATSLRGARSVSEEIQIARVILASMQDAWGRAE